MSFENENKPSCGVRRVLSAETNDRFNLKDGALNIHENLSEASQQEFSEPRIYANAYSLRVSPSGTTPNGYSQKISRPFLLSFSTDFYHLRA